MEENKPKILVVDDEELNVELLEALLCTKYEVIAAFSGEEALEKIEEDPPDLILLDIMMPRMNGYEVCQRVKETRVTSMIPVVMVTALKEKEERIKALEVGADDFLTKPVDRTELMARVKSLLRIKNLYNELEEINLNLEQRVQEQVERIQGLTRLEEELKIANRIQTSFLPKYMPSFEGYDIFADCIPAKEVGGDFYDFIQVDDNRLGLVIGDVAGKGVPAALFTTMCQSFVWSLAKQGDSPKQVMERLNTLILDKEKSDIFVTLFYGILDKRTKEFRFSSAGHNPVFLYRNNGEFDRLKPKGKLLGVFEEANIEEDSVILEQDDIILFYTDGLTEAADAAGDQFGEERLMDILKLNADKDAPELGRLIIDEVKEFVGEVPQFDDNTYVILKVNENIVSINYS